MRRASFDVVRLWIEQLQAKMCDASGGVQRLAGVVSRERKRTKTCERNEEKLHAISC